MPLTTGQILQNRYQIHAVLGRGGMGIVYQAYDTVLQRTVAIKVLPPQLTLDAEFVARFQREAIASANLRHPNIVTVYDVGQQTGEYFIIMEYLEGTTLEQVLANGGPMSMAQASKIVSQIASALDHAHSRGIVHRDVKPSNIMLETQGHAMLMDFGLVRAGEGFGPTRSSIVIGTPEYMAPEQVMGQAIDRRTDIYALGVVIYEMLSGKTPFGHTTPLATAHAQAYEAPPPLRTLTKAVPESVDAVVMKALAKDPAARYQSAGDLARDFSHATGGTMPAGLAAWPIVASSGAAPSVQKQSPLSAGSPATVVAPSATGQPSPPGSRAGKSKASAVLVTGALAAIAVLVVGMLWVRNGGVSEPPVSLSAPTVAVAAALADTPTQRLVSALPTHSPTPSTTPTAIATSTPTVAPTKRPTRAPTATPVRTNTSTPTPAPTRTPTATRAPTRIAAPSPKPTMPPSPVPPAVTPTAVGPSVVLGIPQLLEPPDGEVKYDIATLRFSGVAGAASYLVETRSDRVGQQEWRRWPVPGDSNAINLPYDAFPDYFNTPGTVFYWRVAAVDTGGQPGTYSGERRFVFQRAGSDTTTSSAQLDVPPSPGEFAAVGGLLGLSFMAAFMIVSVNFGNEEED